MNIFSHPHYALVPALGLALAITGCASKRFVRAEVDPVRGRVDAVEGRTSANEKKISGLEDIHERDVSRVEELARTAEQEARDAGEAADGAMQEANRSGQRAEKAHALAEHGTRRVDRVEDWLRNLNSYEKGQEESVLFGFDKHELSADAKKLLDSISGSLNKQSDYAVEVRGFTDTTGSAEYNLALSRKRADSVVRYLTTELQTPLFRIFVAGLGTSTPAADNKTKEGRQMNRRVLVTVYVADPEPPARPTSATASLQQ